MDWANRLASLALIATGVIFSLGAFAGFNQNDFMYATAPIFLNELKLYQELGFLQAPGSIFAYGLLYNVVDGANFHFALRTFSLALLLLSSLLIYRCAVVVAGRLPACFSLLFIFTSVYVLSIGREIGNTPLALFFLSAALCIYYGRPLDVRSAALIGFCIGLSATGKLNFALYAVPFGLFLAAKFGLRSRETCAYMIGGIVGSSLIWYYLFLDFSDFWFFNIRFHGLMNLHRQTTGWQPLLSVAVATLNFLLQSSPALYLIIRASGLTQTREERRQFLEVGILAITALAAALLPLYNAPQYFAPPAFILAIFAALSLRLLFSRRTAFSLKHVFELPIFAALCVAGWIIPFSISVVPFVVSGASWDAFPPIKVRTMRGKIDEVSTTFLTGTACNMTALSLSPIPLIGGAFNISSFSATGPFLPLVSSELKKYEPEFSRYVPQPDDLDRSDPTAFLVGFFPDAAVELEFERYAAKNDFVAFDVGTLPGFRKEKPFYDMQLLVRKSCMSGRPATK